MAIFAKPALLKCISAMPLSKSDEDSGSTTAGDLMANAKELNRRSFLGGSTAGLAALGGLGLLARPQSVLGANNRVRVAICGLHGRGMDHVHNYSKMDDVQIAAVCDIDENVTRERLAQMEKMGIPKPA